MSYIDLAIGIAFFIFFFALVMMLSIQYFAEVPNILNIGEYRELAVDMFNEFFGTEGSPSDWEDTGEVPSKLGLMTFVYRTTITVEEEGTATRTNEPVIVNMEFDDECTKGVWNNTVRVYDSDLSEVQYELVNPIVCSGQLLNESYLKFKVNITQNDDTVFYVYYLNDTGIPAPTYSISYSTSSWMPFTGDTYTEGPTSWSRYGGSSANPVSNATYTMAGSNSIRIEDSFNSSVLGITYNPGSDISGVSNGWYLDAWIYIDNLAGISEINVSVSDGTDEITSNVTHRNMESGEWYHLEIELDSGKWDAWNSFDASNGIDYVRFYLANSTTGLTRNLLIDEMHFEQEPLKVKTFPEEMYAVVSREKVDALGNLTYEELRLVLGGDYRFRIEIV